MMSDESHGMGEHYYQTYHLSLPAANNEHVPYNAPAPGIPE